MKGGVRPHRHSPLLTTCVLLFILCIGIAYQRIFTFQTSSGTGSVHESATDDRSVPHHGRTLVILLDSARYTEMFDPSYMPFVSQLRDKGAWGYSKVLSVPLSIAGVHAMFEGRIDSFFSLMEDFDPRPSRVDNLFRRLTSQGKKVILIGPLIYPAYRDDAEKTAYHAAIFPFGAYRERLRSTFLQAFHILQKRKWDVAVVEFVALDHLGHLETPKSPSSRSFHQEIDRYVQKLVSLTDKRDTILITGEHGMDDRGFHIDRSPLVTDTPFILSGPEVHRKAQAYRVLQIDWAPTLSILNGVNPVYPSSLAIPSLQLLKLPDVTRQNLIHRFGAHLDPHRSVTSKKELQRLRASRLTKGHDAPSLVVVLAILVLCGLGLVYLVFRAKQGSHRIRRAVGYGVFSIALVMLLIKLNMMQIVALVPPFSAHFISAHLPGVAACFVTFFLLGLAVRRLTMTKEQAVIVLLVVLSPLIAILFLSSNLYHVFSWMLAGAPLFALGVSGRWQWFGLFLLFWVGLLIRRLSFFMADGSMSLPGPWVFALAIVLIVAAAAWFRRYRDVAASTYPVLSVLSLLPSLAVIFARPAAAWSALWLMLSLLPVIMVARRSGETRNILWTAWASFFYLGTSGIVDHMTLVVVPPMFLLIWHLIRHGSSRVAGFIFLWVLWTIYILPGNSFDLRLSDLMDPFIMSTGSPSNIQWTVLLIISRYLVPLSVLIGIAVMEMKEERGDAQVAAALFPLVLGSTALLYAFMMADVSISSWQYEMRTVFISIALLLLYAAYMVAQWLNKLEVWRVRDER